MPKLIYDPDALRSAVEDPDNAARYVDKFGLQTQRIDLIDESDKILRTARAAGRGLLASEQRRFDECSDLITLTDRAIVAEGRRREQAAELRMRDTLMLGALGGHETRSAGSFGEQIRNAIDEVRDGRATSFVEVPETRTLTVGGDAGQGVPLQMRSPIESLRARSVVMSLPGIRVERMTSDRMRWPRIGTATVATGAEAATLTAANTDTDTVDVVAAKFGSLDFLSTELEEDYSASALEVFGGNLLSWLALKVDLGLLEGDGSGPGIVGLRNTAGINTTSVAATLTLAKFRAAEYELRLDNAEPAVWLMHPRTWKTAQDIVTGIASDTTTVLSPNQQEAARSLLGYPVRFSTQVTLTEGAGAGSWVALLDTSQIVVCERRPARLEVSRDFAFDTDRIAIRATWRGGLAVLNPEAVSVMTDVRA